MHFVFDPDSSIDWGSVFDQQGYQTGAGDLNGFQGFRYQRGSSGLGGIFSKLFSVILPVVKRVGRSLGSEALLASGRLVDDLVTGRELTETLKNRGNESYQTLIQRAARKLQTGQGRRKKRAIRKRKVKKSPRSTRKTLKRTVKKRIKTTKRKVKKRTTADIFGKWPTN